MSSFKVNNIEFSEGTNVELPELTVVIGPNNSGKSRTLKEVLAQVTGNHAAPGPVLKNVNYSYPDIYDDALKLINKEVHLHHQGRYLCFRTLAPTLDREHIGHIGQSMEVATSNYNSQQPHIKRQNFGGIFGPALTLFLGTEQRISVANESTSAAQDHEESNLLQSLYNLSSETETRIQNHVLEAFQKAVKLDYAVPQKLCFRIADDIDAVPADPRDARPILAKYPKIDEQGDGLRSYLGLVTALITTDRNLILIDEPEAYLHPPQAYRMGCFISESRDPSRQIMIASHSADILRGLLTKKGSTKILRIEQRTGRNVLTELPVDELAKIVNDPLLGSSRVLEGLFATSTVIVEADADARFYQTILRKLESRLDTQCIVADNKQTVPRILSLYKRLGVRSIGIVDIDLISVLDELKATCIEIGMSGTDQELVYEAQRIIATEVEKSEPSEAGSNVLEQFSKLESLSLSIKRNLEAPNSDELTADLAKFSREARRAADMGKPWRKLKTSGLDALSEESAAQFQIISTHLKAHGIHLNPCGELEGSLSEFGLEYSTYKRKWFVSAMKLLDGINLTGDQEIVKFMRIVVSAIK